MARKQRSSNIFRTSSPGETKKLAACFARAVKGGEIICLYGQIGSGKTVFVQGFAKALGTLGVPSSASFALMKKYIGLFKVFHFDLFRLNSRDIDNLGLDECLAEQNAVVVIEWAEAAEKFLPRDRLEFHFKLLEGDNREIRAAGSGSMSSALLKNAKR